MDNKSKGGGAVSDPITIITDHGAIGRMELPDGFVRNALPEKDSVNSYLECKLPGTDVRICYEQTSFPLAPEDLDELAKLFNEKLTPAEDRRILNIFGDPDKPHEEDGTAYGALCQCFICGGRLVRNGSFIDEEASTWQVRLIGDTVMLSAHLRFFTHGDKRSNREALLVIPVLPGQGCGYLWLEGSAQELKRHEEAFLSSVSNGQYNQL